MELLKIIFISIAQGIAEFLPISSSGHIFLLKKIFNLSELDMSFDITVHAGTLLAVIFIYYKDIYDLILGITKKNHRSTNFSKLNERKDYLKIIIIFILAIIPAGIAGLFLKDFIDSFYVISNATALLFLSFAFMFTAIMLIISKFVNYRKSFLLSDFPFIRSILVGFFQAISILPGVSRAGSTITGSIILGLDKKEAGRFSFLMSIPLITAAFLLEIFSMYKNGFEMSYNMQMYYLIGFFTSFIVGVFALKLFLNLINKGSLWVFSIYMIFPILLSLYSYIVL